MTLKMVTATNGRAAQAALLGLRLLLGVGGQVSTQVLLCEPLLAVWTLLKGLPWGWR